MTVPLDGPCAFVVGTLRYEGGYSGGLRDGLWRVSKADGGAPCWEISWTRGEWHGPARSWYPNGQQADQGEYIHGHVAGLWAFWFETGQLAARGRYEADRKVGSWEYWDKDGRLLDGASWERLYYDYDFVAYDDYTGFPRGENWPDPPPPYPHE